MSNWIKTFILKSIENGWSPETEFFKCDLTIKSANYSKIELEKYDIIKHPNGFLTSPKLETLSQEDFKRSVDSILKALSSLNRRDISELYNCRQIIIQILEQIRRPDTINLIKIKLNNTFAGDLLHKLEVQEMEKQKEAAKIRAAREEKAEVERIYSSPSAAKARREKRAKDHRERVKKFKERGAQNITFKLKRKKKKIKKK